MRGPRPAGLFPPEESFDSGRVADDQFRYRPRAVSHRRLFALEHLCHLLDGEACASTSARSGPFTPYVRPQESGGRCGVSWFALTAQDGSAPGLTVHLDVPRQVSLTHFTPADLHAAHRGVGTASCGPDTLSPYLLGPGRHHWSWTLGTEPTVKRS